MNNRRLPATTDPKIPLRRHLPLFLFLSLSMLLNGCTQLSKLFAVTPSPDQQVDRHQQAIVSRLAPVIEAELQDNLNVMLPAVRKSLADQTNKVAKFKRDLVLRSLSDPWAGLTSIEQTSLVAATAAESGIEELPAKEQEELFILLAKKVVGSRCAGKESRQTG